MSLPSAFSSLPLALATSYPKANILRSGAELNNTEAPASTCPQNITIDGATNLTCAEAAIVYEIPTAGLHNLNRYLFCPALTNTTLCAPLSCPITVISLGDNIGTTNNTLPVPTWVASYSNFTLTQFLAWNPYLGLDHVTEGTTVCVGQVDMSLGFSTTY